MLDLFDLFDLFDHGDSLTPLGQREQTTVAPQALYLMDSPLVQTAAERVAGRILAGSNLDPHDRISRAYEAVLMRPPSESEFAPAARFVHRMESALARQHPDAARRERLAWQALCQSLLMSNEFLTIE